MILTSKTDKAARQAFWELKQAAQSAGIPLPPKIDLPPMPTGGCDFAAL